VDLDGTLLKTDIWSEFAIARLKETPLHFFKILILCFRGKIFLKESLSAHEELNASALPYCQDVLAFLKDQGRSRNLVLVTGCHIHQARSISRHLGLFEDVIVCGDESEKDKLLVTKFGHKGFDYLGDSRTDVSVWNAADKGFTVRQSSWGLSNLSPLPTKRAGLTPRSVFNLLRVHQWSKNILVFLPLILSHQLDNFLKLQLSAVCFVSFCLIASAVYILNDLFDVENDRAHPVKRARPIPSGDISFVFATAAFFFLSLTSIALAFFFLPAVVWSYLVGYLLLNVGYSLRLKKVLVLDVFVLTSFYLLRIVFGGAGSEIWVSPWLLSFGFFFFLNLALIKRYSELHLVFRSQGLKTTSGRSYRFEDMPVLLGLGISAGLASVIILSLYFLFGVSPTLYKQPNYLWGISAVVLVWLGSMWIRTNRGEISDDPVRFAITDWFSLISALAVVALGFLAV
jgi:4-hydroxybenzoate polyprenyltransferase